MKPRMQTDVGSSVFEIENRNRMVTDLKSLPALVVTTMMLIEDNTSRIAHTRSLRLCCWQPKHILSYATGGSESGYDWKEIRVCAKCGDTTVREHSDENVIKYLE